MGTYYCTGCDRYHDSKGDAGYNAVGVHQYCDDALIAAENKRHEERNRPSVSVQTQNGSCMTIQHDPEQCETGSK